MSPQEQLFFFFFFLTFQSFLSTRFFTSNVFSAPPQCCLTLSWNEFQMLLRCYLIHIKSPCWKTFYIYYICTNQCLDLGLFMLYLFDLYLIFIFILIMVNCMSAHTLVLLLIFQNMSCHFWMITWMKTVNNFQIAKVQPQGVA